MTSTPLASSLGERKGAWLEVSLACDQGHLAAEIPEAPSSLSDRASSPQELPGDPVELESCPSWDRWHSRTVFRVWESLTSVTPQFTQEGLETPDPEMKSSPEGELTRSELWAGVVRGGGSWGLGGPHSIL